MAGTIVFGEVFGWILFWLSVLNVLRVSVCTLVGGPRSAGFLCLRWSRGTGERRFLFSVGC